MKKILVAISQIVVFWITYEVIATLVSFVLGIVFGIAFNMRFFQSNFWLRISETITYTFTPIIIASVVVFIMRKLYFKTKLLLVPTIINLMILAWMLIDHLITIISQYGLLSWDFANQIWYDVIFCYALFTGLIELLPIYSKELKSDSIS